MAATRNQPTDKNEAVALAVQQIEKAFGKGSIMRMTDGNREAIATISSGALSLDIALGGGIPRGRITEIYGAESSGKTTLALHIIAEAQKAGGMALFVGAEHALDTDYAQRLGVDIDRLYVSQPSSGEEALEIMDAMVRSGAMDIVVLDSVAALVPKNEIEGDMGDSHVGLQARMMSQALRKLGGQLSKTHTAAIFINQIREKIGVMFGNPETTPGGRALKFWSSVRLEVRRGEILKDGTESVGARTKVKVVKNKIAPPFRTTEFDIIFGKGISRAGDLLDLSVEHGFVNRAGTYFNYKDERLAQGRENARAALLSKPEVMEELERDLKAKLMPARTETPVEEPEDDDI